MHFIYVILGYTVSSLSSLYSISILLLLYIHILLYIVIMIIIIIIIIIVYVWALHFSPVNYFSENIKFNYINFFLNTPSTQQKALSRDFILRDKGIWFYPKL